MLGIVVILSMSCCAVFADEQSTPPENELDLSPYVSAAGVSSSVTITGSKAAYRAVVIPMTAKSISKVRGTVKLVNQSGTAVDRVTKDVTISDGKFTVGNSKQLTKHGKYHAAYTLKLYKSGKLIETVTGKSAVKEY